MKNSMGRYVQQYNGMDRSRAETRHDIRSKDWRGERANLVVVVLPIECKLIKQVKCPHGFSPITAVMEGNFKSKFQTKNHTVRFV